MTFSCRVPLALALCSALLGCKSTDQPQYADIGGTIAAAPATPTNESKPVAPATASASESPVTPVTSTSPPGTAKIIIKGTKAGTSQDDIAVALMAATRKLGTTKTPPDRQRELNMARQAADVILAGDKVVLEGASRDTVDSIAEDLRKAGLLVTTTR